jgi:hypothetical protein
MPRMTPSTTMITANIAIGLTGSLFAATSTARFGDVCLALGAASLAGTVLAGLLHEVFWLRALVRSERHQRWLLEQGLEIDDIVRLMTPADDARQRVVEVRTDTGSWSRDRARDQDRRLRGRRDR